MVCPFKSGGLFGTEALRLHYTGFAGNYAGTGPILPSGKNRWINR
ncbi:MAG: hypothetical protein AB7V18_09750 [Pyrinomonadaceae bacterium]